MSRMQEAASMAARTLINSLHTVPIAVTDFGFHQVAHVGEVLVVRAQVVWHVIL